MMNNFKTNKNMKKIIIVLGFFTITSFSQQIVKESIDSGGGIIAGGNIVAFCSYGEVVNAENANGTLEVSEGFISKNITNVATISSDVLLRGVTAFPNPTSNNLHIVFENQDDYQIEVFDMLGRLVLSYNNHNKKQAILNFNKLKSATYMIVVEDNQHQKIFKVIKN